MILAVIPLGVPTSSLNTIAVPASIFLVFHVYVAGTSPSNLRDMF